MSGTEKHLTLISDGILAPGTRFRVDPVLRALEAKGWTGRSIYGYGLKDQQIATPWIKKGYRIACRLKRAMRTAMLNPPGPVFLQRLAIPNWSGPEVRLAKRNERVVFDFDDAIFMNHQHQICPKRSAALEQIFHHAAHIVAGNSWLADHVPSGCNVTVIPTCLDTEKYKPSDRSTSDAAGDQGRKVRVGWMGTSSNYPYLEQLVQPLRELRDRLPERFELIVCSDEQNIELLKRLDAKFVRWTPDSEVATLRSFDIGLMPLAMDDWCRGKCSFKLIQYFAVGKPVVCTPVGMNLDVVTENENGLFAVEDWASPLQTLIEDPAKRQLHGDSGRKTAVERYSLSVAVDAYERIFASLL